MVNRIHAFGPELLAVGALAIGLHLVRHPLPFLDQGGHGNGKEGCRLHCAELPTTNKVERWGGAIAALVKRNRA